MPGRYGFSFGLTVTSWDLVVGMCLGMGLLLLPEVSVGRIQLGCCGEFLQGSISLLIGGVDCKVTSSTALLNARLFRKA